MRTYHSSYFLILAIAAFATLPVQAQQNSAAAQGMIIQGPPVLQEQRIVDEVYQCASNSVESACTQIPGKVVWKTVTFQIPDFKPGDQETHAYQISGISDNSSGGGSAQADEYGILQKEERIRPGIQGEAETQYYFTAVDINTLEARVTLDLYEARLWPFLNSLQSALHTGTRMATRARWAPGQRPPVIMGDRQFRNQRLSIQGDNLTVEEVLDKLYQNTGCIVDLEAEGLVVASCP